MLKRPGKNQWLVQDELGGSVESMMPPEDAKAVADIVMKKLAHAYSTSTGKLWIKPVYARIDLIRIHANFAVSELELVEPELFFLARSKNACIPNAHALECFRRHLCSALSR